MVFLLKYVPLNVNWLQLSFATTLPNETGMQPAAHARVETLQCLRVGLFWQDQIGATPAWTLTYLYFFLHTCDWMHTYMKEMCRRFPHYKYELCHNLYLHLWLWLLHMPLSCLSSVVMGIVVCQSPDTVSITQGTPYTHSLHIQHISLVPGVHKAVINSGYHIQVSFS